MNDFSLSYLWINVGNINISFQEWDYLKFYRLSGATFYDCINTIYQFIKPFLDNKVSVFEEYGAFKTTPLIRPLLGSPKDGLNCRILLNILLHITQ